MADTCPDCKRPFAKRMPEVIKTTGPCCREFHPFGADDCMALTLTRLRARVAELEQAHAEQVAEREHLEEGARLLRALHELELVKPESYGAALDRWLEAERSRQAKGAKREGSG